MEGFIGDIFDAFIWLIIIVFVCATGAFFFHLQRLGAYQRQANSIIQNSRYVPSYDSQFQSYSASDNSPEAKLFRLDKKYEYDFTISPARRNYRHINDSGQHSAQEIKINDPSESGRPVSFGSPMYYDVNIHVPFMSVGTDYYGAKNGSYNTHHSFVTNGDDRPTHNNENPTESSVNYSNKHNDSGNAYKYAHRATLNMSIGGKAINQYDHDSNYNTQHHI